LAEDGSAPFTWQTAGGTSCGSQEGRPEMSEFDELVAEHKTTGLYIENSSLTGMAQWFRAAVTTMSGSMAYAVGTLNQFLRAGQP
jgi:hypothetical protein